MAKQSPSPLALVAHDYPQAGRSPLAHFLEDRSLTRDEMQAQVEANLERAVIELTRQVGDAAITAIDDLHVHGYGEFERATGDILAIKGAVHSPEQQLYLDAYAKQLIPLCARHTTGVIEVAAHCIAAEVHRSKRPTPRPFSLMERLFGRQV